MVGSEVRDDLRFMNRGEFFNRFEFNDQPIFHKKIDAALAHHLFLVRDVKGHLPSMNDASQRQFDGHRGFVNGLRIAWPKQPVDLNGGADHLRRCSFCRRIDPIMAQPGNLVTRIRIELSFNHVFFVPIVSFVLFVIPYWTNENSLVLSSDQTILA
jgi:hypothetical protein